MTRGADTGPRTRTGGEDFDMWGSHRWGRGIVLGAMLLAAGCGDGGSGGGSTREAPALVVDGALDVARTQDFLRIIYLPANVEPTTLGAPSAVRVFVGASAYFMPPLAL